LRDHYREQHGDEDDEHRFYSHDDLNFNSCETDAVFIGAKNPS